MNYLKHEVKIALASKDSIFIFKEGMQQLVHTPVAEHIVKYLTILNTARYQNSKPEHIFFVDNVLQRLQQNGHLEPSPGERTNRRVIIGEGYNSLLASKFDNSTKLKVESLIKKLGVNFLFVDDFNDPNILSTDIFRTNKPYILLKPFGLYPAVSPVFGEKNHCYHCFSKILLSNQPVRNWLFLNNNEKITVATGIQIGQSIKRIIEKLETSDCDQFNLFDQGYNEVSKHAINSLSSCMFCGDPNTYTKQTSLPITLESVLKNNYRDGGFRTVAPEVTLKKLKSLVDPVTGYICNSHTQKKVDAQQNVIYFSSFYTQPFNNTSFRPEEFIYTTMGKGVSHQQSQISALSEAVERIASQYHGDEPLIASKQSELTEQYVSIGELTPFSDSQYSEFEKQLSHIDINKVHQCTRYDDERLNWTFSWSLISNTKVYLPFNFCYANTPFNDKFVNFYHNGGSAGNCIEEAILQGIFELIERDAVALWWYNKLDCPRVDFSSVSPVLMNQIETQLMPEFDVWVLDLTQDIAIPVMCAIAQHKFNKKFVMGFGCHLDAVISCQRALTELFQLIEIKDNNTSPFSFSKIEQASYLFGGQSVQGLEPYENNAADLKSDIDFCIDQIKDVGMDVLVINNTRPDLKLSSVKVIVPGLCHIFPYFGLSRLYTVPVKMGWLTHPKKESELNQQALLI